MLTDAEFDLLLSMAKPFSTYRKFQWWLNVGCDVKLADGGLPLWLFIKVTPNIVSGRVNFVTEAAAMDALRAAVEAYRRQRDATTSLNPNGSAAPESNDD